MKRITILISAILGILLVGGAGIWFYVGRAGSSSLEKWIGGQVIAIIDTYINPKVAFKDLDYQAPRTVIVEDLRFTDSNETIMAVNRLRLELAEIPREGKPIKIQQIHLENANLAFVQAGPDRDIVGWGRFVRDESLTNQKSVPKERRLSDVLELRSVSIKNGEVVYDPRDGSQVMTIPGIELDLQMPQAVGEQGWHTLNGVFKREPILNVAIDGRINLDTVMLELKKLSIRATLGESQYSALPPAVQRFLRDHRVRGELTADIAGSIPLKDPSTAVATIEAKLSNVMFAATDVDEVPGGRGRSIATPIEAKLVNASARITLPQQTINVEAAGIAMSSGNQPIFTAEKITAEIPRFPTVDQPLILSQLELDTPKLFLMPGNSGGFIGWEQLLRKSDPAHAKRSDAKQAYIPNPKSQGSSPVVLQRMNVRQGAFSYGPRDSPMALDGIDITLAMPPVKDQPGWYQTTASIRRTPLLNATLAGRINIYESLLNLETFDLQGVLNESQYQTLPPQVQRYVREHQIRGNLQVSGKGSLVLTDLARSDAQFNIRIRDSSVDYGEAVWPISALDIDARIQRSSLRTQYNASALGGRANGDAIVALTGDNALTFNWNIAGVRLEETLRAAQRSQPTRSGKVSSTGKLAARLERLPASLTGDGRIDISEARLVNIPIIREMLGLILNKRLGINLPAQDKGSFNFQLRSDHVQLNDIKVVSAVVALTGSGRIFYDKRLDMTVNAGLLERLESALGDIGKILGAITNKAVAYHVGGTLSEPRISLKPLGLTIAP